MASDSNKKNAKQNQANKQNTKQNQANRQNVNRTKNQNSRGKGKAAANPSFSYWFLLPAILMIAVVPLIMRYYKYNNNLKEFGWILSDETVDFFIYYKSVAIIILGVIMLCIIAGRLFIEGSRIKFSKAFIPMFVYALFIIFSAIASQYPVFVSGGIREQFESVWVLLSYCIMAYYCFLFINNEKDVETIFFWLFIGSLAIALIGVFQFFKLDLFRSDFGQQLIIPKKLWKDYIFPDNPDDRLTFTFPPGRAYVTLYNPNYVGMYVSMITPCLAAWMVTRKKLLHLIAPAILMAGLFLILYSAGAKNGVVALVVGALLYAAAYRRVFLKKPIICIGALVAMVAFFFVCNHALGGSITNGIKGLFKQGDKRIVEAKLEKIETTDEDVVVYYGGNELHVTCEMDEEEGYLYAQATDQDGNVIEYSMTENGMAYFPDERFSGICIFTNIAADIDIMLLGIYIDDGSITNEDYRYFYFSNSNKLSENGSYYCYNSVGNFVKMETSESGILSDNPELFSGRGYIWSKTIPLLKKYIIIGSGPDTFEVAFPQNDAVSMRQGGYGGMVITKPHNLFLQIGINTGVISLIGYLGFYFIYFIWSFKLFFIKAPQSYMAHMGVGILCGTFGYIISGIINDSTVCVAPIYWCLMGIGIAINVYCEKEKRNSGHQAA